MKFFFIRRFSFLLFVFYEVKCLDNGAALTPPMGWLSWERFGCNINCNDDQDNCISEMLFKDMADRMVADKYLKAGYKYVNIDDCWLERHRDSTGKLVADHKRFPNGIKHLAQYMHDRGLKLGIYQNMGWKTCMNYPGSRGHLSIDAKTFVNWNVDMVKMDGCLMPVNDLDDGYKEFGSYLNRSAKPIVYSCSWPYYQMHYSEVVPKFEEIAVHCNLWRVYHDIHAKWSSILSTIDFLGDNQVVMRQHVGPGKWFDPDMLLIGNKGLNYNQAEAQMGIWSIFPAPLLMSNDLRTISDEMRQILLKPEVIAINQDKLGIPGRRIYQNGTLDIWLRQLSSDHPEPCYALCFLHRNQTDKQLKVKVQLKSLGLNSSYSLRDVFSEVTIGIRQPSNILELTVPPTGIRLLKLTPIPSREVDNEI